MAGSHSIGDGPDKRGLSDGRGPSDESTSAIAKALQGVTEKAQLLVREEIELAKAEVTIKAKSLGRGAAAAAAGGIFALVGLLFLLEGLAWLIYYIFPFPNQAYFWGFFITAALLFLVGGLAAFLALKAIKKGSPPTPEMAIEEAQRIKATVQSKTPESTI